MDGGTKEVLRSIREASDKVLLYLMSCTSDSDRIVISKLAGIEFQRRHGIQLRARCRRICQMFAFPQDYASALASLTLYKAVQKHHTFREAPSTPITNKRTCAWLGMIARNIAVDTRRNPDRPNSLIGDQNSAAPEDYTDEDIAIFHCDRNGLLQSRIVLPVVQEAFSKLDQRTKAVLTHTALEARKSPGKTYMYRGSLTALARRWNTSSANIRKIRRQGTLFIDNYVKSHSKI